MHSPKYGLSPSQCYEWAVKFESAKKYLQRLNSEKTRRNIASMLWIYCTWTNQTPDTLIELKSKNIADIQHRIDAERLLDSFCTSEIKINGLVIPESIKSHVPESIRGFYRVNYWQLEKEAGHYERPQPKARKLQTKEQRFMLYKVAYNPRSQFAVVAGLSTAIALETMSKWRFSHFENDWMQQELPCCVFPSELLKGHGKGKYKGVKQVTFLTPEAKRCLLEYREWFSRNFGYQWRSDDYVFLCVKRNVACPLGIHGLSRIAGDVQMRTGIAFGLHDGRRVVQTALENAGAAANWIRKIKGRKVRGEENPYTLPEIENLRQKFKEVVPDLEFLGVGFKVDGGRVPTAEQWSKIDDLLAVAENEAVREAILKALKEHKK